MSDARNIAKPLTPTKSKKDEVLYWRDIDALSQPKQQKKPAKTKAKQKRKIRPTHDANTVTLQLSGEQIATVQCSQDGFHKLLTALIDYNIQHKREYGRYLDWDTLERLTRIKTGLSQARGLPNGAGQMAAKNVRDIFMRYTRSDGEPDCDPATLDHPETYNIYVTDIAAEQGKLRFPHIGWVDYVAPTAVRGVFESKGIHIKGAFLSHRNKLWRAEIRFKRLNGKQINQNVKFAFAVAKGYVEPDEKHMVDECLFEQILNLASAHGLELDRYLPS